MSSNQFFIYDSDGSGWVSKNRSFSIKPNEQRVIRAGGLTEEIQIFQMVGQCNNCRPEDVIWEPLYNCGLPVVLSPENNNVWVSLPGTYSIGDPNSNDILAGDVNITGERYTGVDSSLLGKCSNNETTITNTCDNPVNVSLCDAIGIETSMAELGCIVENDVIVGKIMLCKTINEDGTGEVITKTAYYEDGTEVPNYDGPWQVCAPEPCQSETFIGVITDLTVLSN